MLEDELDAAEPDLRNLLVLASVEERRGDMEAMERVLRRALDVYPDALEPRLLLGRYALQRNRPGEAVDLLTPLRESHGDDPRLQETLVNAFMALEQPGAAANAGRRLALLAPENPDALRLAALAELADENVRSAEDYLRKGLGIDPNRGDLRRLLVETQFLKNDAASVAGELAGVSDSFSDAELGEFARTSVSMRRADPEAFGRLLQLAHDREPSRASTLFVGFQNLREGRADAALETFDRWLADHPKDTLMLRQVGDLHASRGEDALAAAAYELLYEQLPNDIATLNNLAWSLRATDTQRALELVDSALSQAPAAPAILDTQAMVLMHAGRYDEALRTLEQVAEAVGDTPAVAFHRAQILAEAGRIDEAREMLEALVEGPEFPEQGEAGRLLRSL